MYISLTTGRTGPIWSFSSGAHKQVFQAWLAHEIRVKHEQDCVAGLTGLGTKSTGASPSTSQLHWNFSKHSKIRHNAWTRPSFLAESDSFLLSKPCRRVCVDASFTVPIWIYPFSIHPSLCSALPGQCRRPTYSTNLFGGIVPDIEFVLKYPSSSQRFNGTLFQYLVLHQLRQLCRRQSTIITATLSPYTPMII